MDMTAQNSTTNQISGMLRNASDPFILHLTGEPYELTREMLHEQAEAIMPGKRKWTHPYLELKSYESGILKFEASPYGGSGFTITFYIEPDKLHVSCSCATSVEKLCIHAFKALEAIITREDCRYFERYRPNGIVETGLKYPKLFEKKTYRLDLDFTPKKNLGCVYLFSNDILPSTFADILDLPADTSTVLPEKNMALTYILMFSHIRWKKTPPFLLPCLGIKNKAGTNLKFFEKFLSGTEKSYQPYLTEGQKSLNDLCFKMWKQAENSNGKFLENEESDREKLKELFSLWERAILILQQQEYVYRHPFYWARYLKGKPSKSYMHRIVIEKERPKLFFHLADKGNFYQLCLKVDVDGKSISQFNSDFWFFIEYKECYYLLASLRDVGILEWMRGRDNRISILKEHFEEFEEVYLHLLQDHYPVKRL
jgi:hypothetical protein